MFNNQGSSKPSNPSSSVQSFLESLRQQSTASGPDQKRSFTAFEKFQEKKRLEEERKAEFFQSRTREYQEIYSLKKRQEERKIEEIHEKLTQLTKSFKKLNKEIQVAVTQTDTKSTGAYHEGFFDHLNQMIDILKRQVDSSQTWLHLFNQRSRKKSYFWGQVQKSGTNFLLSGERTVATSVG